MSRQSFFEHDNRTSFRRPNNTMGRRTKFYRGKKGFQSEMARDIDMEDSHLHGVRNKGRFNPYNQKNQNKRKHKTRSGKNKHDYGGSSHLENDMVSSWHKITVHFGKKMGKDFILRSFLSMCTVPIIPVKFQFNRNDAEFYVKDSAAAREIRELHRKITSPDGFKVSIRTERCPAPEPTIDPESSEILKNLMSTRFNTINQTLDLSKFSHDENMRSSGFYLPLNRYNVCSEVAKIIKEHIPLVQALILSDNRLTSLSALSSISTVCKNLKSVVLQNNKLRSTSDLDNLKGLELTDLVLDGNPLCDVYNSQASYISAVRERFPKLLRLDHHELPAPIVFDLGEETLPVSKKSFFAEEVKDLVIQFLDQYYTIYDSGDRARLLDAYHDQACFSICLSKDTTKTSYKANTVTISSYNSDNRNLLRVTDAAQRFKLLKQGKLAIVNALSELPQTMHDPTSFSVDIFHVSPGLMSFSVVGVFKEVGADINNATLKTFSRTFVVAAIGSGFVIVNETLFMAHASQEQQSKAFKVPAPTPSPSPAPSEEKSQAEKSLMAFELQKHTGMNLPFCTRCLEEMDWDYQKALEAFTKLQSEGKLPPEAFMQ